MNRYVVREQVTPERDKLDVVLAPARRWEATLKEKSLVLFSF
jgi:hypothetical protein